MSGRAVNQGLAPCGESLELFQLSNFLHPFEKQMPLQEWCIGRIDQRVVRTIEEGSISLRPEGLFQTFKGRIGLSNRTVVICLSIRVGQTSCCRCEGWKIICPGPVDRALDRILRV